jgi:hypothetical protein
MDEFNRSIRHRGAPTFIDLVRKILDEQNHEYPTDPVQNEAFYFTIGWWLAAAEKEGLRRHKNLVLRKYLCLLVTKCHIVSDEERCLLPSGKTRRVEKYSGRLKFPNKQFYSFATTIELVFEKSFINRSLVLYGGKLVNILISTLSEDSRVLDRLKSCFFPEEIGHEDTILVFSYLINTYMHMRGRDFVRKLMGRAKKDPIVGHRQEIAAISKGKKQNEMVNNAIESDEDRADLKEMNHIMESIEINVEMEDEHTNIFS